jgi:hypothetical protein
MLRKILESVIDNISREIGALNDQQHRHLDLGWEKQIKVIFSGGGVL